MAVQLVDVAFGTPSGSSLGDNLSNAVLTSALFTTGPYANYVSANATAMKLDTTIAEAPYCKFSVNGITRDLSNAWGWIVDLNYSACEAKVTYPAQSNTVSCGYLFRINLNPAFYGGGNIRIDASVITGNTGSSAYDNYLVGAGGYQLGHHIETDTGDSIVPGCTFNKTYWVTMAYTVGNPGVGKLQVYDATTWAYLGESSRASPVAATTSTAAFGSDAVSSVFAGYSMYLKGVVVDLSGKYPLGVPEQPSAPTAFAAGTPTASTIPLTWTPADTKEQSFQVFRSFDNVYFGLIATTAEAATGYTDSSLPRGQTAYYKVRAHNVSFDSVFSSVVSATTTSATSSAPAFNATTLRFP